MENDPYPMKGDVRILMNYQQDEQEDDLVSTLTDLNTVQYSNNLYPSLDQVENEEHDPHPMAAADSVSANTNNTLYPSLDQVEQHENTAAESSSTKVAIGMMMTKPKPSLEDEKGAVGGATAAPATTTTTKEATTAATTTKGDTGGTAKPHLQSNVEDLEAATAALVESQSLSSSSVPVPGAHAHSFPRPSNNNNSAPTISSDNANATTDSNHDNNNTLVEAELVEGDYQAILAERDALKRQMESIQEASAVAAEVSQPQQQPQDSMTKSASSGGSKRQRWAAMSLVAVLVLVLVIIVVAVTRNKGESSPSSSSSSSEGNNSDQSVSVLEDNNYNTSVDVPVVVAETPAEQQQDEQQDSFWQSRQVGQSIFGKDDFDEFGEFVSMSHDGSLLAAGGEEHGDFRGLVVLHSWIPSEQSWKPVAEIVGDVPGDESARVTLSSDGTVLAIAGAVATNANGDERAGRVRTYRIVRGANDNNHDVTLEPMGQILEGEVANDRFGADVQLSANGRILTVGVPSKAVVNESGTEHGCAHVFSYDDHSDTWIPLGQPLWGDAPQDFFGHHTALSSSGHVVAVGGKGYDGNGVDKSGIVRVYQLQNHTTTDTGTTSSNETMQQHQQQWMQLGDDFYGEHVKEEVGRSISLSSDGRTIVLGGYRHNNSTGRVYAFQWDEDRLEWNPKGQPIDGLGEGDRLGRSVGLSGDGSVLAAGAYWNDDGGDRAGHVRAFYFQNTTNSWEEVGPPIVGTHNSWFGRRISLARDGRLLAIGGPFHNTADKTKVGKVDVYELP